ncbi:MAG: Type phosphodiesterase / nucleotide pyrophosphatase [Euryarchaeota archaeon]|nr:Type phosphodiesterase / nucleotide pyrophosphatase [Euryarchaeota archaeon]
MLLISSSSEPRPAELDGAGKCFAKAKEHFFLPCFHCLTVIMPALSLSLFNSVQVSSLIMQAIAKDIIIWQRKITKILMTAQETLPPLSQIDIAPTAALILDLQLPKPDGRAVDFTVARGCKNVAIIIIDSLGYDLFMWLLPALENMRDLCADGQLLRITAVSNHTTPAIASILCGLLPEHHEIFDKAGAKESRIKSLPEIAAASGQSCAVIMEQNGAEVYQGLIKVVHGIPDSIPPQDFDREACAVTCQALREKPRLLVSYFIGIDKSVHLGLGRKGIKEAALLIDRSIGEIVKTANEETLFIICGDHPIHAGPLKRTRGPYCVAMILAKGKAHK